MTTLFNRVRNAALIALALGTIIAGAAPAQALSLKQLPEMGSSSDDHHDCDSRREVKYFFQEDYHLKNVNVSKTHDYYIYKVSGLAPAPEKAESLVLKDKSSDYVRYVFLWDACEHEFVEWIKPSHEPVEFQ
jgi:hypothetical protein